MQHSPGKSKNKEAPGIVLAVDLTTPTSGQLFSQSLPFSAVKDEFLIKH